MSTRPVPKQNTDPQIPAPSSTSQSLPPAESPLSTRPVPKQNTNPQTPVSPPPVASIPAKLLNNKKGCPATLLIALTIVLAVGTSWVYFARQSPSHTPSATPTATAHITATPSSIVPDSALITPGTLTVGVSDSSYNAPPEIYSNNGSPAGFDVELSIALAQAMKLKINIKPYPIGNIIPPTLFTTLKNKQFDIMINVQALTVQVSNNTLSVPYLAPKDVVLVPDGNPNHLNFNTTTDLCGHTIGAQDNTIELYTLQTTSCQQGKINTVPFPTAEALANALIQKPNSVEAIYQSTPTVSYYQYKYPGKLQQVGNPILTVPEGIIIRQDNDAMHTAIQNAFHSLEQDGTYQRLLHTSTGDLTGDIVS